MRVQISDQELPEGRFQRHWLAIGTTYRALPHRGKIARNKDAGRSAHGMAIYHPCRRF
jgi:hypothetical protein